MRRERSQPEKPQEEADPQEAVAHFQKLVEENPHDAQALFGLGSTYYVLGRYDEAVKELERAVARDPNHVDSHYYLGLIYARRGEREKARQELELVAKEDPRAMMRGYAERKLERLDSKSRW